MKGLITANWSKLFKMYFNMDISEQFLYCLDIQLTEQFTKATTIRLESKVHLAWDQQMKPEVKLGRVSTMVSILWLKYGRVEVVICWSSKSGKVYNIDSLDIESDDIQFWFDDLQADKWNKICKPDFSRFFPLYDQYPAYSKKTSNVDMSVAYVLCMREHLSRNFEFQTGLKINKNMDVLYDSFTFFYTKGDISRTQATIYINHNWNPNVQICWKSKSGRIYEMTDEYIDCEDIVMWFEGLEPALIHRQLYPKNPLPFKLKDLSYELQIDRLQKDCQIVLSLRSGEITSAERFLNEIYDFIDLYNISSEEKQREMGVVHHAEGVIKGDEIILNVDLGSTGSDFFQKMLSYFSELSVFRQVVVG